jgi:hypothetical protein
MPHWLPSNQMKMLINGEFDPENRREAQTRREGGAVTQFDVTQEQDKTTALFIQTQEVGNEKNL